MYEHVGKELLRGPWTVSCQDLSSPLRGVCGLGCPGSSLGQSASSIVCGVPHQPIGRKAVTARGRKRTVHLTQCPFKVLGMARELAPRAESSPQAYSPSPIRASGYRLDGDNWRGGNIYYLSLFVITCFVVTQVFFFFLP